MWRMFILVMVVLVVVLVLVLRTGLGHVADVHLDDVHSYWRW